MRTRDRERLDAMVSRTLETFLIRIARFCLETRNGPSVPRLPPGMSCSEALRLAARLRSGAVRVPDSKVPPAQSAELLERSTELERMIRGSLGEAAQYPELYEDLENDHAAERKRRFVARFHRLKESAAAQGPDSPDAQRLRRLHRLRRKEGRRARRRRGGGSSVR